VDYGDTLDAADDSGAAYLPGASLLPFVVIAYANH